MALGIRPFHVFDPVTVRFGSIVYLAGPHGAWLEEAMAHLVKLSPGDTAIVNPHAKLPDDLQTAGTQEEKHRYVVAREHWQNYHLDLTLRFGVVVYYFSNDAALEQSFDRLLKDALELQVKSWDSVSKPVLIGIDPALDLRGTRREATGGIGITPGTVPQTMEKVASKLKEMQRIPQFNPL